MFGVHPKAETIGSWLQRHFSFTFFIVHNVELARRHNEAHVSALSVYEPLGGIRGRCCEIILAHSTTFSHPALLLSQATVDLRVGGRASTNPVNGRASGHRDDD